MLLPLLENHCHIVDPVALVIHVVLVGKLAVAVPQIILIVAQVLDSIMVVLHAKPALLVVSELALEVAAVAVPDDAPAVPEPVQEIAPVVVAVRPEVLTLPIGLVLFEAAHEPVPILKPIYPMSLLVEIHEFAFVPLAFLIYEHAEPRDVSSSPFAQVRGSPVCVLPQAAPMLEIVLPLAVVDLAIRPLEPALPISCVATELPFIKRAVGIGFAS